MDAFTILSAVLFVLSGLGLFTFGYLLGKHTERQEWTAALQEVKYDLGNLP